MNIVVKEYSIATVKSLIGAIPFVGTALNEAIFDARGRIKQDRINHFIEELSKYLGAFSKEDFKMEHIRSEEFGDFFEVVLQKVSTTNNADKIKRYKELLASQMVSPHPLDFSETFLDLISRTNDKQILILKKLYDLGSGYTDWKMNLYSEHQKLSQLVERAKILEESEERNGEAQFNIQGEKSRIEQRIKQCQEELSENDAVFKPETYNCIWHEFSFLLQDLSSKSLVVDVSSRTTADPFSFVEISSLGINFLEFIDPTISSSS